MITRAKTETMLFLLPNLFTTGNLFFGCLAIYMVIQQNTFVACLSIIIATLCDVFDGRLARLAKVTTVFGVEYDSLSDLISFGVAPALLVYHWGFFDFGRLGWAVTFVFIVCGALRLARFNTEAKNVQVEKAYFKGLPIPAAANFFTTLILLFRDLNLTPLPRPLLMILVLFIAMLMVSPIPFRSFKNFQLLGATPFIQLVVIVLLALLILIRWETNLFIVACLYIGGNLLIFLWHITHKLFRGTPP